jgi:hypothetical protein
MIVKGNKIKLKGKWFDVEEFIFKYNSKLGKYMKIARLTSGRTIIMGSSFTEGGPLVKKKKRAYKWK